jgi:hypothetical protein
VHFYNGGTVCLVYDFTTTKPTQAVADYTTLKFSDEFNTDGAPDPAKWSYDLGTGSEVKW